MSSKIEWTDETWNPTLGCTRVSPGCDNCYAIRQSRIRSGNPHPAIAAAHGGLTEHRDGRLDWTGDVQLLPDRLAQPLHWRRPRRIFVDSLTDLFHDEVPDGFIWSVWVTMARTPQHTYQLLTKRHGRMRSLLNRWAADGWIARDHQMLWNDLSGHVGPSGLQNVWLGVSVEDQQRADLRIPALLDTPAAVRWISAEPLLGPVSLYTRWDDYPVHGKALDWVVVGGESGPGARPMHPGWARSLRDQCAARGVPFLFKQHGDWAPRPWSARVPDPTATGDELAAAKRDADQRGASHGVNLDGHVIELSHRPWSGERDDDAPAPWAGVSRVGKKAAGRELDGRTHDEYPAVVA